MFPLLVAAALALPQPISTATPVPPITWTAPIYSQANPVVASNGSMAFAAWSDSRFGPLSSGSLATRVDADGKPLDPVGIVIPGITLPEATLWSGDKFVVIGRTLTNAHAIVSVSVDGTTSEPKSVDLPAEYTFAAVSSIGPDVRILYVRYDANEVLTARIVDVEGNVVVNIATPLPHQLTLPPGGARWIAAGRTNDFGIFGPSATVRLDRHGKVLANTSVAWPFPYFESTAVAGTDGQGFVLLHQGVGGVLACQVDDDGAFTGKTAMMDLPWVWQLGQNHPAVVATGTDYIVINNAIYGDNSRHEYLSRLSFDLSSSPIEVPAAGTPVQFRIENGQGLLVATQANRVFLQKVKETLEASQPVLLNIHATIQAQPAVAAAASSYAVAWYERGADSVVHTYIRRWRMDGEPIDGAPLDVNALPSPSVPAIQPALAATPGAYIING